MVGHRCGSRSAEVVALSAFPSLGAQDVGLHPCLDPFRDAYQVHTLDQPAHALAQGVCGLVEGMHLIGIAEGIETRMQADILRAQGWECGQGYYFGRPAATPMTHHGPTARSPQRGNILSRREPGQADSLPYPAGSDAEPGARSSTRSP